MAYIRLPLGIRVAVEYEVFGKIVVNVYHVTTSDPITSIKLLDICDIFANWWVTEFSLWFDQDIAQTSITALNLNEENGLKEELVISPPEQGQGLTGAVSNNVAIVASFGTTKTGRSFQGRSYQAGFTEVAVTANEIQVGMAAGIVADYVQLISDLSADNDLFVVASFQNSGVPRELGVATPIASVSVNLRVDTQRRRLPK